MTSKRLTHYGFPSHAILMKKKYTIDAGHKYLHQRTEVQQMSEWKQAEGNIFKFEETGDAIEGVLLSKEKSTQFDNMVYKIKREDDTIAVVFGTAMINGLLEVVEIGSLVRLEYKGEKENKKAGQSPTKLFDVQYKDAE